MNERGFSLIEVMVATIILIAGVIALASSSATITRMTAEGNRAAAAALVASSRFESLRAVGCTGMSSGSATSGRFTESWEVTSIAGGAAKKVLLRVSYRIGSRAGTRAITYGTVVSCRGEAGS
ncbi:MAG TPA: prepilin-type N-terminal cleavage/methylation domain-containing protein [Gemmatimonadales bacterium]|nr:prepilin-type N-terminal cleavage/methylation domain-containing protein [Gemmatimonadales bacterium]